MHSENARVRLLMVDDEADGFERVGALLQVRGWRVEGERVSTSEAFRRRLAEEDWDVVLSERVLPGWEGRDVLTVVRALSDAPQVVFLSHIPEDAEAEHLLREGAADYVSKANPARLAPAIARSVRDATLRRELRRVRTALREEQAKLLARRALSEGEQRYRGLFHESVAAIAVFDSNKRFVDVNQAGLDLLGYPRDELLRLAIPDVDADPAAVMPAHLELLSGGRLRNYRHRLRRKDGRVITVLNNSRPITAAGGTIVGLLSTLIDVTDLELAQERVRLQGEQLRMALEAADMVTWHLEVATGRLTYSTNLAALSGADDLTPYVTLDRFVLELHPEDREPAKRAIDATIAEGVPFACEYRLRLVDGDWHWLAGKGRAVLAPDGRVTHVVGVSQDITERKRLQARTDAALVKYRTLFETLPLGVTVADREGRILESNRVATEILGLSPDQASGRYVGSGDWNLVRSDRSPMPAEEFASVRALREGRVIEDVEMGLVTPSGAITWIRVTAAPVSLPEVGVVVTYRDISARKQAEEALRESEARRELALEAARLGTWEWDLRTDRHAWSVFQERLFGYEPGTFPGTSEAFTRRIHPEDIAGLFAARERARVDGLPFRHEFRVLLPDGGMRWVSSTGRYLFDKGGSPIRVIGVVTDVTERHNAEQRLASEATRRRILIEGSRDGIVVLDRLGGVVETNSRFAEMLGRSVEEVNRMHAWEWDCRWTREEVLRAIVRDTAGAQFETRHRRKDGSEYDVEISTNGAELDGELLVFCLCRDISGRKRLESQLRQAQKLEAVGQLAGGVAHDFNNIIAAMMMQLGLLSMSERLDDETAAAVRDLEAEAQRAAKLTRQLLMFSRRSVMEVRPLDLNELVRDLLKMLGRLIGEHIRLEFRANDGPLPAVEGDAGMVEQVLMNLVVNARDAMPKGGTVTIATRVGAFETGCAGDLVDSLPGHIVCLSVADTGIGMSEETLKHIFEPFFTTKESGKGTGLGLATVHGIVAQHRGWVEVESREGRGSTFRVYFPVADTPFVVAAGDEPFGGAAPRGHETILVVEDETSLRHGIVRTLRALGYRVYEAENGQQAMRLWEKHGREVDLLLTDMVMPEGITGLELGEQLRNHKPSLRMILSTGYSADIVRAGGVRQHGVSYLPKPFRSHALGLAVRECLDGPG